MIVIGCGIGIWIAMVMMHVVCRAAGIVTVSVSVIVSASSVWCVIGIWMVNVIVNVVCIGCGCVIVMGRSIWSLDLGC